MNRMNLKWRQCLQIIAVALLCGLVPETASETEVAEPKVVCYYTNWSVYRPGQAKFNPQNINPYLCTHLIYAFGGFTKDNTLKPFDKYQDIEKGGYAKFTGLKTYNKQLKTLLAIGGWNEASSRFSPMVASLERRIQFAKNAIKFLRQNHFDGLDLDWEYPAARDGGKPRDRANYAQFVQELREEFDREANKTGRPRLLLTMAVPAGEQYVEKGFDIPKLNRYLDWFNLLTYDYHSSEEPSTAHHAPLYPLQEADEYNYESDLNIESTIKYYLSLGANSRKLVLGLPTYGRSYTLFNPEATDLGSPTDGPGEQGDATREKGYLAYYEICQHLRDDSGWTVVQPNPSAMGPYAYKENQWVGFDDESIASRKAEFAAVNNLGGIMFWSIDNDDFRGECSGKPYPIIEAAKSSYFAALGFSANDLKAQTKPKGGVKTLPANKIRYPGKETVPVKLDNEVSVSSRRNSKKRPTTVAPPSRQGSGEEEILFVAIAPRTTPAPPPTPSPAGSGFKCEDEGFFPHPSDCKKYYWCLDSGPSDLGIVAHMFTCPGGLFFNTAADSCDYARNVICAKPKKTTPGPSTTKAPWTTTARPKLSPITVKSTAFRTTQRTTTTTEQEVEEYDEDEEEFDDREAEDPQVLKELITLINKAGGIANLEKQLLVHKNGTVLYRDPDSSQISTTPAAISASLYDKILTRNQVRKEYQPIRSRQNFASVTESEIEAEGSTAAAPSPSPFSPARKEYQPIRSRQNFAAVKETEAAASTVAPSSGGFASSTVTYNRFSFNSRTKPQNEGLAQLDEFTGFVKDKPKYTTLSRNKVASSSSSVEEELGVAEIDQEEILETTTAKRGNFQYQYVNLQRRPNAFQTTVTDSIDDKTDFTEEETEPTAKPFTASAPRGFTPRYTAITRQSAGQPAAAGIDEKLLFDEEETTETDLPATTPTTTTSTTTTASPTKRPSILLSTSFRRKTSVSPEEEQEDEESKTITPPYTETQTTIADTIALSPNDPQTPPPPLLTVTTTTDNETVNGEAIIQSLVTDAPLASTYASQSPSQQDPTETEIPNEIFDYSSPIQTTILPEIIPLVELTSTTTIPTPLATSSTTTTTTRTTTVVAEEKPRKTIKKFKPTRGPIRPNSIPRGRAVTQSVDQDESHSETSFQTVDVSQDQTYRIRSRGRSRYRGDDDPAAVNEAIQREEENQEVTPRTPRNFKPRSTTTGPDTVDNTEAPVAQRRRPVYEATNENAQQPEEPRGRGRSRRPNRPTTHIIATESETVDQTEVTQPIRPRGFQSRNQFATTSLDEIASTLAPEIPSPRNQPRKFESRFNGNDLSATDSPIFRIKTTPAEELSTGTSQPPIKITLESALNFGYANRKQLRNQVFTLDESAQAGSAAPGDSKVIRPAVNVRFGIKVNENPQGGEETSTLVTKPMERDSSQTTRIIVASSTPAAPQLDDLATRRTTIAIGLDQQTTLDESQADFRDATIEGQTLIPFDVQVDVADNNQANEEDSSRTTLSSIPSDDSAAGVLNTLNPDGGDDDEPIQTTGRIASRGQAAAVTSAPPSQSSTSTFPARGRTRTNIRRRPITQSSAASSSATEATTPLASEAGDGNQSRFSQNRFSFRNQRRTTTTIAPQLENEEEVILETSSPANTRNRFNSFRRRTTTEASANLDSQDEEQEVISEASPTIRGRQRGSFGGRFKVSGEQQQLGGVQNEGITRGEQLKNLEESLTLKPIGNTRTRFNGARFRTTTDGNVASEGGEDVNKESIVASSTTAPRQRNRFIAGRARTTSTTVSEDNNQEEEINQEIPSTQRTANRFQSRFRTTTKQVDEEEISQGVQEDVSSTQRSANRFQSRFRTTTQTSEGQGEEEDTSEAAEEESSTTVRPAFVYKPIPRKFTTLKPIITITKAYVDEDQKDPDYQTRITNKYNEFKNKYTSTTALPSEVPEPVTLNDEEEIALLNQVKQLREQYSTQDPSFIAITDEESQTDEGVTGTDEESTVTESPVPTTTRNRFQVLRNRFSTESTPSASPSSQTTEEAVKIEKDEEVSPVTRRNPLNRFQSRNRFSTTTGSTTEAVDSEDQQDELPSSSPSSTSTSRFRSFQSRTRTSTASTESPESIRESESTPDGTSDASPGFKRRVVKRPRFRTTEADSEAAPEVESTSEGSSDAAPGFRRRVVKRPRLRTTEADEESTPASEGTASTAAPSFRTSRRRQPYGTSTTEAIQAEVTDEQTQAPRDPTRARKINASLFTRNRINILNQQQTEEKEVSEVAEDQEHENPIENNGRVTYRRKIIRKKPNGEEVVEDGGEVENIQQESGDDKQDSGPRNKIRKVIRRLRPKTTPGGEEEETATESIREDRLRSRFRPSNGRAQSSAGEEVNENGADEEGSSANNEATDSTRPTLRTTLRRGKTQNSAKTLEDLRRERVQAQENQAGDEEAVEEEQGGDENAEEDPSTPRTTTRGRYAGRSRAPFNPKQRLSTQSTTEPIIRVSSPRNRFSSRVKGGRVSPATAADSSTNVDEDNGEQESPVRSASIRPLSFTTARNRLVGSRFRNTYKGSGGQDEEISTVLRTRTNLFANRNRGQAETSGREEVAFEQVTDSNDVENSFDDEQYVDDNYEGVTELGEENASTTATTTTRKVANVPINPLKRPINRPSYNPINRKPNLPSTATRQSNVPYSPKANGTAKADTTKPLYKFPNRKANTPADLVAPTDSDPEITTTDYTAHSSDDSESLNNNNTSPSTASPEEGEEESSTDETNAVNLQEYYARGGNGTPTPGPLSSLLNRTFKPKKLASTTTKPTTLHHVFAIDYENDKEKSGESSSQNKSDISAEEVSKKLRKLIEINRIVEVYSSQKKSRSEVDGELMLERVPTLDKVGEISRLAVIKLKTEDREGRSPRILTSDMIFGVETSTIGLEGLFDKDRKSKELVVKTEKDENNNTINVVYARTITQQDYPEYAATSPLTTTTTTETPSTTRANDIARPLVPQLRPETNEDNPLIVSIANLDQVILTKLGVVSTNRPSIPTTMAEEAAADSTSAPVTEVGEEEVQNTTTGGSEN